ncbi:hypothetical protein MKW98_004336 [Papaver atlanticum]|uniref:Uncharacterized protein n=1 Tax=Papaver atlanticum TaxID=357466 RepID=A0AAD4SQQ3_9MAGN|nr:hypothetical protein MKW98_004336 [Papaver atlanticum]
MIVVFHLADENFHEQLSPPPANWPLSHYDTIGVFGVGSISRYITILTLNITYKEVTNRDKQRLSFERRIERLKNFEQSHEHNRISFIFFGYNTSLQGLISHQFNQPLLKIGKGLQLV